MNVGNDDTEPATNLELSLGYSNHCISSRVSDPGAGVNAASRVHMAFVASDPLSELVWSPHNGLSLKCADCSFAEKTPPLLWGRGPSNMMYSPPQSFSSKGTAGGKCSDKGNLSTSQMALHREVGEGATVVLSPRSTRPVSKSSQGYLAGKSDDMEEVSSMGQALDVNAKQESNTSKTSEKGPTNANRSQKSTAAVTRENDKGLKNKDTTDFLSLGTNGSKPAMAQTEPLTSEGKNLAYVIEKEIKNEMKIDGPISVLPLRKSESTAENDWQILIGKEARSKGEEGLLRGKSIQQEVFLTHRETRVQRGKGKEKVLSDGDVNKAMSKEEDDSHESVESCNSVGIFSVGKKRWRFDQPLISGSKRVKNQNQENSTSTSFMGQHSSFINWISNMVKGGLNKSNQETPSLALTLAHPKHVHESQDQKTVTYNRNHYSGGSNKGFHTIFRSIYGANPEQEATERPDKNSPIKESKEFVLADKTLGPSINSIACNGENGTACTLACADVADRKILSSSSVDKHRINSGGKNDFDTHIEEEITRNVGNGRDVFGNLWIARYSPKSPALLLNVDSCNQNKSKARINKENDEKSTRESNYSLPALNLKNKEAMASLFAKRLGAFKHIILSDADDKNQTIKTCFYCGKSDHDLHSCSEITKNERENIVRNISSYDGTVDSPCLCIKCFQLDHWAISCPMSSTSGKQPEHGVVLRGTKQCLLRLSECKTTCDEKISQFDIDKPIDPTFGDDVSKGKKLTPLCTLVDMKFLDIPKGMSDVIRKLRLSRMDILKWMNCHASLACLDGYFLRLRLGKWQKGLGGTGYYAACISGEQRVKLQQSFRNPIRVDIGGVTCLVESQYISNHDFLEDELIAWWSTTAKSGGKIPSEDDLKLKLEQRKRLGI